MYRVTKIWVIFWNHLIGAFAERSLYQKKKKKLRNLWNWTVHRFQVYLVYFNNLI